MAENTCDVAIVGGGLVGASIALGLGDTGLKVSLIEPMPPAARAPSWDERCIALNHASRRILEQLDVWSALAVSAAPIRSTHISEQGRFGVARFSAEEAGLDALGHNVPLGLIAQSLWDAVAEHEAAQLVCGRRLSGVGQHADHVELALDDGSRLAAKLVVAADGMNSPLRGWLNIEAERRDYEQSAIVTAVRTQRPHRGCAYERFTSGGPIAVLPKPWKQANDVCSLVWTTPAAEVERRLAWSDDEFIAHAEETFGERLGRFVELGRRQAHPLQRVLSARITAPRVIFAGNAAQSLHPVAAQGFNLGLRDAATLAELLHAPEYASSDPGAPELLERYAAQRRADRDRVAGFTDHLVRLFSNRVPGLHRLRHLGLLAIDLAPPLRDAVLWQNLGFGGRSPAAARR